MLARRLLLFTAVLLLVAMIAAALSPQRSLTTPPPSPLPAAASDRSLERTISAEPGTTTSITLRRGQTLQLEVEGELLDSVQIDGLGRVDGIEPLTPARFQILAESPGTYPIRLVEADRRIGRLRITP